MEQIQQFMQIFTEQGIVFEDSVLDEIAAWVGGLLYHLQRLCMDIAQSNSMIITKALIESCIETITFDDTYLSHILRQLRENTTLANHARTMLVRPLRSNRNIDATASLEVAGVIRYDPLAREWKITNRLCEFALQQYFALEGAIVYPTDEYTPHQHRLRRLLELLNRDHPRYSEALVYQHRLIENITKARFYSDTDNRRAERAEVIAQLNELALSTLQQTFSELYEELK